MLQSTGTSQRSLWLCPADALSEPGSGGHAWVPRDCHSWRESSWQRNSPGHCRLRHTHSLSTKEAYLLVLEAGPEGQASGVVHRPSEELSGDTGGHTPSLCSVSLSLSASLHSSLSPRKKFTHSSGALIFSATQGTPLSHTALVAGGDYT